MSEEITKSPADDIFLGEEDEEEEEQIGENSENTEDISGTPPPTLAEDEASTSMQNTPSPIKGGEITPPPESETLPKDETSTSETTAPPPPPPSTPEPENIIPKEPDSITEELEPEVEKTPAVEADIVAYDPYIPPPTPINEDNLLDKNGLRDKYKPILGPIKCVIIDLDGTLFNIRCKDIQVTRDAVHAFNKLRTLDIKYIFVINTWLRSKQRILKTLNRLGFEVGEDDLFTSTDCAKIFMSEHHLSHPFLLVADEVQKDFPDMETLDPLEFDSVVIGLPSTMIDYRLLTKALNLLYDGKPMIVINSAKAEKSIGLSKVVAPGHFSQILQYTTDAKRYMAAKPTPAFYEEVCKYLGMNASDCLMIGDDITEDVRDAKAVCLKAALVKTGKYVLKDEEKYCCVRPDVVADDFASVIKILCAAKSVPDSADAEDAAEAIRRAKLQMEKDDFNMRLKAYAAEDCNRSLGQCPPRLPSLIW